MIIKGVVSIVKEKDNNVFQGLHTRRALEEHSEPSIPELDEYYIKINILIIVSLKQKAQNFERELEELISKYGVKIKEMKEGEAFGEKALIEKNAKRTTSVITNTNCEFIVINKNDYINIINKYDRRRQIKTHFMKTKIPCVGIIRSPEIWEDIFYVIKDLDYPIGSVLVNEGDQGNRVFFIVNGYCELEKNIVVQGTKTHCEFDPIKMKKTIAKLGPGSCLGEEILIGDENRYDYTIKVTDYVYR